MNKTSMYTNRIIIALRAFYARIKALWQAVIVKCKPAPKKVIQGVIFLEQGKTLNTEIYLGQTIHLEPFGNCKADPQTCVHAPIERISIGKRTIVITAKGVVITFVGTILRTIYER